MTDFCHVPPVEEILQGMWRTSWDHEKQPVYEKWKTRWFACHPEDIAAHSWDYLFTGGKEIRARLFCELWNYLTPDQSPPNAELAFAIECIHATSLILDDSPWMDNAAQRRGRKTLHLAFTEKKSLMIAHDVMRMVCEIWHDQRPSHLPVKDWNAHLLRIFERLAIGQWYDLERQGTLVELASLKTGVLFEGVAETVALCLSLDTAFWSTWGNRVGILFQWADDWDDREEDAEHNRNAFNESYEATLSNYESLWSRVQYDVGTSWFDRPFGQAMRHYFTKADSADFPLFRSSSATGSAPESLLKWQEDTLQMPFAYRSEVTPPTSAALTTLRSLTSISGIELIRYLLQILQNRLKGQDVLHQSFLSSDLWNSPEEKWGNHPEILELCREVEVILDQEDYDSIKTGR